MTSRTFRLQPQLQIALLQRRNRHSQRAAELHARLRRGLNPRSVPMPAPYAPSDSAGSG
jgi:hypothetical protein